MRHSRTRLIYTLDLVLVGQCMVYVDFRVAEPEPPFLLLLLLLLLLARCSGMYGSRGRAINILVDLTLKHIDA